MHRNLFDATAADSSETCLQVHWELAVSLLVLGCSRSVNEAGWRILPGWAFLLQSPGDCCWHCLWLLLCKRSSGSSGCILFAVFTPLVGVSVSGDHTSAGALWHHYLLSFCNKSTAAKYFVQHITTGSMSMGRMSVCTNTESQVAWNTGCASKITWVLSCWVSPANSFHSFRSYGVSHITSGASGLE